MEVIKENTGKKTLLALIPDRTGRYVVQTGTLEGSMIIVDSSLIFPSMIIRGADGRPYWMQQLGIPSLRGKYPDLSGLEAEMAESGIFHVRYNTEGRGRTRLSKNEALLVALSREILGQEMVHEHGGLRRRGLEIAEYSPDYPELAINATMRHRLTWVHES